MTIEEARIEAEKRWSDRAFISDRDGIYLVGTYCDGGGIYEATGISKVSWEEAFQSADKYHALRLSSEKAKQ